MKRTYVYIISLFLISTAGLVNAQDTILFPLKIKAGIELSGPAIYFTNKSNLSTEGYLSVDINEKTALVLAAGYLNYKYSQYNYNYLNKGIFFRVGTDINLRKPEVFSDKYWAGIGLRYGLSIFSSETPSFKEENYWGTIYSSVSPATSSAHFLEVTPGIRTEIFKNFSIGWSVSLRLLVYNSSVKDTRPIYIPGFGRGDKSISTGISYFMAWSIPYKKIKYIVKPETVSTEETPVPVNKNTNQQSSVIRQ
jgi:hypothetical protein